MRISLGRNTAKDFYDELLHIPERARHWNEAICALALDDSPWDLYHNATIQDIGDGYGDVGIGLARHLPSAKFIVQDVSETARRQGKSISQQGSRSAKYNPRSCFDG